jgi:hypothetical protein
VERGGEHDQGEEAQAAKQCAQQETAGARRRIGHEKGGTDDGEGERCGGEELPEALAGVFGVGEAGGAEDVVMASGEDGELDDDEGQEEGVEQRQRNRPLPQTELSTRPQRRRPEPPAGGEGESQGAAEHQSERDCSTRQRVGRGERGTAAQLGEGGVRRPEKNAEREGEQPAEQRPTQGWPESGGHLRHQRRQLTESDQRRSGRRDCRTGDGDRSEQPGSGEIEGDHPAGVDYCGKSGECERERTEGHRVDRGACRSGHCDADECGDEHYADAERLTR